MTTAQDYTMDRRVLEFGQQLVVSIVMPCLNEAETLEFCIVEAQSALAEAEVVVADNGSTDGSQAIARRLGARVVDVATKGYGAALQGGIAAARGELHCDGRCGRKL
jgi:glycosyltransferase involved in cell wall biosynthesis